MELEQQINYDLQLSGLELSDMKVRPIDLAERAACGVPSAVEGYVIPYFSITGKVLPFYRTKLFGHDLKYKQIKNTSNHTYFPPNFLKVLDESKSKYVIITEGEKKAARATKCGFPTIAFGGVDSWRNRILLLPKDTEFSAYSYNKQLVGAKLPSSSWDTSGVNLEPTATGFDEFCNLVRERKLTAIIVYDSDEATTLVGMKPEVQRAAAELGFELRRRGIPLQRIRQTILPVIAELGKTGLDDYLTIAENGIELFKVLIEGTMIRRSAFPQHPNMEEEINKKLQAPKLSRKDVQRLSLTLITDLDSRGIRMNSEEEQQLYYFQEENNKLIKVDMGAGDNVGASTPFAKLLYQYYGISMGSDTRLIKWLATQFSAEDPVESVDPFRVIARADTEDDCLRYQINDGQYVKITSDPKYPMQILHNGAENILFESGQVENIDASELIKEFDKRTEEPLEMWWEDVLQEVRLKSHGQTATLFSLLFYISPWLLRWRGTQLPAELIIGEAGSGKSTLCELRLNILTGQPNLRNAPTDLKDWHASIVNTGGLHVTDNVQMTDKTLKQRLSDEICRLITEPDPHIEMRKYYTNADLMRMKVDAVFCFTSISQPFSNSDLLQRAVILELDKMAAKSSTEAKPISYDSSWKKTQLDKFGGRTAWLSHHLFVLHKFFQAVQKNWNPNYQAKHRLINLEQMLIILADMFGIDSAWIPGFLAGQVDEAVVEADWSLEGLKEFCIAARKDCIALASRTGAEMGQAKQMKFSTSAIAAWAMQHESYMECIGLTNARRLGRYLQTHKSLVSQVASLVEAEKYANKMYYKVLPRAADQDMEEVD